jgi:hypothetical protein
MAQRVSAAGVQEGHYRQLALKSLQQAADRLNALPQGQVYTAELQAHATMAQAIATIAIGHALIELGDALRAAVSESEYGS